MARGGGRRATTEAPGTASGALLPGSEVDPTAGDVLALERALRVRFRDHDLARASLTHRSFAFEHGMEHRTEIKVTLAQAGVETPDLDGWFYSEAAGFGREVV